MSQDRAGRILAVDDDRRLLESFQMALEAQGFDVVTVDNVRDACVKVASMSFDLCLLDKDLNPGSGLEVLGKLREYGASTRVIMVTADADTDAARQALESGVQDYLVKPCSPSQLRIAVMRQMEARKLSSEVESLRREVGGQSDEPLAPRSPAMQRLMQTVEEVAPTDANVLILGDSGTGKGVVARAIHAASHRKAGELATINCPSLSGELLESELFGHTKGAFTGAVQPSDGRVAAADGGSLFLDEIGDFPMALQSKLLRFIQDKAYERLGDPVTRHADVRIISATNRDLPKMVEADRFRLDLYYRINVITLKVPSLRERGEDILPLAEHYLGQFASSYGRPAEAFTPAARSMLASYSWPGNIRELRNVIERAVILCNSPQIAPETLALSESAAVTEPGGGDRGGDAASLAGRMISLRELEQRHIQSVISQTRTLDEAARVLGVNASTLYRKRRACR